MRSFEKQLLGLLLGAVGSVLAQCATGPDLERHLILQAGAKVALAYQEAATSLTLINQSGLTGDAADRAMQADLGLKIIPDQDVQRALDVLGGLNFFKYASDQPTPGSSKLLVVVTDRGRHLLTERNVGPNSALAAHAFAQSLEAFLKIYNHHDRFAPRKMTAEDLEKSSEKLNRSGRKLSP